MKHYPFIYVQERSYEHGVCLLAGMVQHILAQVARNGFHFHASLVCVVGQRNLY